MFIAGAKNATDQLDRLKAFAVTAAFHVPCGMLLAFSLRGGWLGLLSSMCLSVPIVAAIRSHSLLELGFCQMLFGLGFYPIAFAGLLGPLDGACGGVWLIISLFYAAAQTAAIVGCCWVFRPRIDLLLVLFPFAWVGWEYLRHLATRAYDGCGLTFCLIGQSLVDEPRLLQSAELGGAWLLSFLVALHCSAIAGWASAAIPLRRRVAQTSVAAACSIGLWCFGYMRLQPPSHTAAGAERQWIAICDQPPAAGHMQSFQRLARECQLRQWPASRFCILFPETCMAWSRVASPAHTTMQANLLEFSREQNCDLLVGAWVADDSRDLVHNALVVVRAGRVMAMVDKQHPAPFVESRPFGTEWLIKTGMIPQAVIRNVAPPVQADHSTWQHGTTPYCPSVCYDVFFSETFAAHPVRAPSITVCSADESFDGNGVFKSLSRVHSKLRSVEQRQPLVRSSLGGSSGAFDAYGRSLEPVATVNNVSVFKLTRGSTSTLYERYGDWLPRLCCGVTLAAGLWVRAMALRASKP